MIDNTHLDQPACSRRAISARWLGLAAITACVFAVAPAAHAGPVAFVTSEKAGVSVLDLDSLSVARTFESGGKSPRGLALSEDGHTLVVANKDSGDAAILDADSGRLLHRVAVGRNPEFVRIHGNIALVTFEPQELGKLQAQPGQIAHPEAAGKAAGKDDDDDDKTPAQVAFIDIAKGKLIRKVVTGVETEGIEFTPDGSAFVVANEGADDLMVFSLKNGKLLRTVDLSAQGHRPRGIKLSPDRKTFAVSLEFSDKLLLVDAATFQVIRSAATQKGPYGVSFDPKGQKVFVAAARSGVVQVLNTDDLAVVGEAKTGARCWHFALHPDEHHLMAVCGRSNDLVVVDLDSLQASKSIPIPGMPWGIVTYPRTFGSIESP